MDAPLHFVQRGRPIDRLPLDATVGRARIIAIQDPRIIDLEELRRQRIRVGERLLFKTRNSELWSRDGFSDAFLPQAFSRFTREEQARTSPGTGLGLSIIGAIALAHGGSAGAANRPGGGADVWLSLPTEPPAS